VPSGTTGSGIMLSRCGVFQHGKAVFGHMMCCSAWRGPVCNIHDLLTRQSILKRLDTNGLAEVSFLAGGDVGATGFMRTLLWTAGRYLVAIQHYSLDITAVLLRWCACGLM
jgi:hypothetical protein